MKNASFRRRLVVVPALVLGLGAPVIVGTPSHAGPLVTDAPHAAPLAAGVSSGSDRSKARIVVQNYPKRLTIGGSAPKGCSKSLRVKITGPRPSDGQAFDLIYAVYVVESPQPMVSRRLRNVVPGKSYRLYPYAKPEYGPGYEVTLCATFSAQLLPLPWQTKQVGTISLDLVEAGSSGQDPVTIRTLQVKIRWRGQAQ